MSKSVEQIVLETIQKDCTGYCSYRYGDGEEHRARLGAKLVEKLKHRVADGNDVRLLTKRIELLEKALGFAIKKMENKVPALAQEITYLRNTLSPPNKEAS